MKKTGLAIPAIRLDRCTGCGWCVAACPPHVLSLHVRGAAKISVLDSAADCTGCALCWLRCPFDAIRMVRRDAAQGARDLFPVSAGGAGAPAPDHCGARGGGS